MKMRFIVVLSILVLTLAFILAHPNKRQNKATSSRLITMPLATFFPSRNSTSGVIHMIQSDIHPANMHPAIHEFKGSTWMERCCGLKGDYPSLMQQIKDTEIKFSFNCIDMSKRFYEICCSDLKEIIAFVNDLFQGIENDIDDHLYIRDDTYAEDIKDIHKYGDELKQIHDSMKTSQYTKHMIEKICVDMHTNVWLMASALGENVPLEMMGQLVLNAEPAQ
ncbi:uncharacterized protein LOC116338714 [Contarinia nasturtii]|uniref:uncharacterized protein LOC116338714 n=1 Tax=Contarinia nasturtii TaxID=265458 RepID=UPI0012D3CB62|nr:uncharacterized protein LOC116338714 [Contarinia nasturtii]